MFNEKEREEKIEINKQNEIWYGTKYESMKRRANGKIKRGEYELKNARTYQC